METMSKTVPCLISAGLLATPSSMGKDLAVVLLQMSFLTQPGFKPAASDLQKPMAPATELLRAP